MQRNQVTEKLWNMSTQQFSYTPHLFGDTMLVKKILHTQDFITSIYYDFCWFIIKDYGFSAVRVLYPINF